MYWHYSREGKTGLRSWWHFGQRSCFHIEANWWTHFCHLSVRATDEGWTFAVGVPPLAIWLCFDGFGLWRPQRKHIFTWDNNREVWLTDQREFTLSMSDWTIRFVPWGKSMEWVAADPWWVRGVSFDFKGLLGRQTYVSETVRDGIPIQIPMVEGAYTAVAKFERATWKRPLWFGHSRLYTSVDVPKGIPFQGKSENSWDCGDDGLYGYSVQGHDIEKAIAHGVESVLKSRRKYGKPSDAAIREALNPSPMVDQPPTRV